jgi:hypothetical protein
MSSGADTRQVPADNRKKTSERRPSKHREKSGLPESDKRFFENEKRREAMFITGPFTLLEPELRSKLEGNEDMPGRPGPTENETMPFEKDLRVAVAREAYPMLYAFRPPRREPVL